MTKMKKFKDKFEHSVMPSLDYPFATEVYSIWDSRYKVTKLFKSMLTEKMGVCPYNCKISLIETDSSFFNVFVYFWDIREIFSDNEIRNMIVDEKPKQPYISMFMEALKCYPVPEIEGKKMNSVFFQDFRIRACSKSLKDAEPSLKWFWNKHEPQIVFTARWDDSYYLFFNNENVLNQFCDGEHIRVFKKRAYEIISPHDMHNVWSIDSLKFIVDVHENYTRIGGGNYFNSDAMFAGKVI